MGTFSQDEIYRHMQSVHGGIGHGEGIIRPEELLAQAQLLREAEVRRARERERELERAGRETRSRSLCIIM